MHYLTPADLIAIHELLIAQFGGMRGITEAGFGRLEAAAAAPQASMFGEDLHATVAEKAAALCQAIVRSHPFSDGNKRVALVALDLFLAKNGATLTASNQDVYELMMVLARGEAEFSQIVGWVRENSTDNYS